MSRFLLLPAIFGLGMSLSFSAHSADAAPVSSPNVSRSTAPQEHQAIGKVTALAGGKITLAHQPIPSLNWPAMEMGFALADPNLTRGIAVGETVRFVVVQRDRDYIVTQLVKQTP